jgi:ubiquinone/menaquinone biosynthesis C-methylase UbiE
VEDREYAVMRSLEDAHWWYRSLRSLVLRRMGEARRILDVGCGTGGMLALLAERDSVGVDVSPLALLHTRGRGVSKMARASASALPFADATFDLVLALDVFYHRAVPDDAAALAECSRVVRPEGRIMIHAPAYQWLFRDHDRAVHGVRRYTARAVDRLVKAAGLQVEELTYRNLLALPVAALLRLFRCRASSGASDLKAVPGRLNAAFRLAARVEGAVQERVPIPFGLSVWCVGRKPAEAGPP